jgi:8-oxo-dGTP pyrophosphatase MutT (NUDIX family)
MNRRIAVRAIIERDGKILCAQLKPYHESIKANGFWSTPGGGIDEGESLIPALQREIMEELGVHAVIGNLLYVQQFEYWDQEHLEFFFHVTNTDDFIDIDYSQTTHGAQEIERLAFVDASTEKVRPLFLRTEPITTHIASGGPVKFFSTLPTMTAGK